MGGFSCLRGGANKGALSNVPQPVAAVVAVVMLLVTVIVAPSAQARSGALNTAGWAGELNRELYAVPGDVTMPHNTGCNRLIQDGKASIVCSLSDISELCHEAHRPHITASSKAEDLPPSDDPDHCKEDDGTNTAGNDILHAIRACRSRYGTVSADGILDMLNESHPDEYSIAAIMQELGALELSGIITMEAGRIAIASGGA